MKSNKKKLIISTISATAIIGTTAAVTAVVLAKDNNKNNNFVNDNEIIGNNLIGETTNTNKPIIDLTPSKPIINNGGTNETGGNINTGGSIIVGGGSSSQNQPNPEEATIATFSASSGISMVKDVTTGKYTLTIQETPESQKFGELVFFVNGEEQQSKTLQVNSGDKVTVKAKINDEFKDTYTLTKLRVYSEGQKNITLETTKEGDNTYTFTMPSETDSMGRPNPFYNGSGIVVESVYGVIEINDWKYDFNTKAYKYQLSENDLNFNGIDGKKSVFITNNSKYPEGIEAKANLDLQFHGLEGEVEGLEGTFVIENSNFVLDTQGYDVYFSGYNIPHGCNLAIHNTKSETRSKIFGNKLVSKHSIILGGVLTQGFNVDYVTIADSDTEFLNVTSQWQLDWEKENNK